jgi:hypothetical protein
VIVEFYLEGNQVNSIAKYIKQNVKHDDSLKACECFSYHGVGDIYLINGIKNSIMYIRILSGHMLSSADRQIFLR